MGKLRRVAKEVGQELGQGFSGFRKQIKTVRPPARNLDFSLLPQPYRRAEPIKRVRRKKRVQYVYVRQKARR